MKNQKELLSGNEAIARGAYESGVNFAAGYPGTPSSEILENIVNYPGIYAEWSVNEKVALESAAGASWAGARCIVTMKHVGLNVASDPLMTLPYVGVKGGLVIVVADDPSMHSSQNEQDSRNYAKFAKVPLLEPSDSQEAKDFVKIGIEISEKYDIPVILRSTTRISHSKGIVKLGTREENPHKIHFEKNPQKYVTVPAYARVMRVKLEEKIKKLKKLTNRIGVNKIILNNKKLGIITGSISYQYAREVFPDASFLKLGMSYPFPDELIRKFASLVKKLVVIEELDPILEEHIRSLGIKVIGKEVIPDIGELNVDIIEEAKLKLSGKKIVKKKVLKKLPDLPKRPPVLCPGCPHRGIFYALKKCNVSVVGDIGCYSLATYPPLESLDSILCMGAGISACHGMDKVGYKNVVGVLGDSTFFHSGMTSLLDIAYNKGASTIIILDNKTTAMTGHQHHPGTGKTIKDEETVHISIGEIARAFGIKRVREVNPYNVEETYKVLKEEISSDEPSVIITTEPCILNVRGVEVEPCYIDADLCVGCGACLKVGCPALEKVLITDKKFNVQINTVLCTGCEICCQVCKVNAIKKE